MNALNYDCFASETTNMLATTILQTQNHIPDTVDLKVLFKGEMHYHTHTFCTIINQSPHFVLIMKNQFHSMSL